MLQGEECRENSWPDLKCVWGRCCNLTHLLLPRQDWQSPGWRWEDAAVRFSCLAITEPNLEAIKAIKGITESLTTMSNAHLTVRWSNYDYQCDWLTAWNMKHFYFEKTGERQSCKLHCKPYLSSEVISDEFKQSKCWWTEDKDGLVAPSLTEGGKVQAESILNYGFILSRNLL